MNRDKLIEELFIAIDSKNTKSFCTFLADDCELTFGNMPTVTGRDAIFEVIDGFFNSISGLSHKLTEAINADDALITYGVVTYTHLDNRQVAANFCNVFKMSGDLVKKYRIFVDVSQLYV
jgi:hypothetical protein